MRVLRWVSVLVLGLSMAAPVAAGKLYKWVDEKGNVHFSDKVPPEAAKLAHEEMNQSGITVKEVARAKTQEEIAAEAAQKLKDEEASKIAEAQAQEDRALMLSYTNVEDLIRARDQELGVIDSNMATAKLTMASQEKSLSDLLAHAADYERNKKAVPQAVNDSVANVRAQIELQQKSLVDRKASKETVRKEYDTKLARWHELASKNATTIKP
ncbi:MAG: DUF4124 domain-containing protein [Rhodanobacteraceae bacterium]|nr:DUF4124 domain-containing protein [Rhodanobacteraceae bacterium]